MKKISLTISFNLGALMLTTAMSAQATDTEKDKQLVEKGACMARRDTDLNAPISSDYPKLTGQRGDHIYHALLVYQINNNPLVGHSNAIMMGQVNSNPATIGVDGGPRPLAQAELKDIAAYIESLPGSLVLEK